MFAIRPIGLVLASSLLAAAEVHADGLPLRPGAHFDLPVRASVVQIAGRSAAGTPRRQLVAPFRARVTAVKDGDTIAVLKDGREVVLRLAGIDCPEKSQAFGQRAKQATSRLAFGEHVLVQPVEHDRYGRLVAVVVLPDGRNLNEVLVAEGMAWWYRKFSRDLNLQKLEFEARVERRGLWSDAAPIAPWEYRVMARSREKPVQQHTID